MTIRDKIDNKKIVEVLVGSGMHRGKTCEALCITRTTLRRWIEDDPELHKMMDDAEEERISIGEDAMMRNIEAGCATSLKMLMTSKRGRARGYGTSIEFTGDSNKPLRMITEDMNIEDAESAYRDVAFPEDE